MAHVFSAFRSKAAILCNDFDIPSTHPTDHSISTFDLGFLNSKVDKAHRSPHRYQKPAGKVPITQDEFFQFTKSNSELERTRQLRTQEQRELDDLAEQQAEKNRNDKEELLRILHSAEEQGNVIITHNPADDVRQMKELLELVQKARSSGHVRILKRKTTSTVALPGFGHLQLALKQR